MLDAASFYQWLIGTSLTMLAIGMTLLLGVVGWVSKRLQTNSEAIKSGDVQLHARITKLREDMTDNYARKSDLDQPIARQEALVKEVRDEHREAWNRMDKKLDELLVEARQRVPPPPAT